MERIRVPEQDFNPRSREGSDALNTVGIPSSFISIHAPAKGATFSKASSRYLINISIHAPAKGATGHPLQRVNIQTISIHAPAKGATLSEVVLMSTYEISIHAPAKGATAFINIFSLTVRLFLFHLTNKI